MHHKLLLSRVWGTMCRHLPIHVLSTETPPVYRIQGQCDVLAMENAHIFLQPKLEDVIGGILLTFSYPITMCPDLELNDRLRA